MQIRQVAEVFKKLDELNILYENIDFYLQKIKQIWIIKSEDIVKDFEEKLFKTRSYEEFIKKNRTKFKKQDTVYSWENNFLYWGLKKNTCDFKLSTSFAWILRTLIYWKKTNQKKFFRILSFLGCYKLNIQEYPIYTKTIYWNQLLYITLDKNLLDMFKIWFIIKSPGKCYMLHKKIRWSSETRNKVTIITWIENVYKCLERSNKLKKWIMFYFYFLYCLDKKWVDESFFEEKWLKDKYFIKIFKEYFLAFILYKSNNNKKIENIIKNLFQ